MIIMNLIICSTDKPAHKIADKISENCNNALMAVVNKYINNYSVKKIITIIIFIHFYYLLYFCRLTIVNLHTI